MYARIVISKFIPKFKPRIKSIEHGRQRSEQKLVLVEKDKTGVWLSEQLGVTAVTVSKWCNNVTQPTLPTIDRIAEILGCEKRELITE